LSASPSTNPSSNPSLSAVPSTGPSDVPSLSASPSSNPSFNPTVQPTACPTDTQCSCEPGDETIRTWKCGNNIYICPDPDNESVPYTLNLCNNQATQNSIHYLLTKDQCTEMLAIQLQDEGNANRVCIALPQYCLAAQEELSDRVCYTDCVVFKDDTEGCGTCNSNKSFTLAPYESCEPTAAPN
jgi:hypothetical protein